MSVGLIDFLRAWGESLFKNKGAWASAQAHYANITKTSITASASGSFTAPSDGLFGIYTLNNREFDVYASNSHGIVSRSSFGLGDNSVFAKCSTIAVSKGSTVTWAMANSPSEIWFIPSAGSQ